MKISKKLEIIILISIILIGFIIRVININQFPPSLNWDEISHGYNAYSILKTGKDEWGISFPTIFRAFGDYKLPLYIYLTVPSIAILGLNSLSVRLVSILAGTLLPLIIFLIVKHFFTKKSVLPILTATIVAFSPGFIFLSRIALEANLFLLLFCLSFYFLLTKKYGLSTFIYGLGLLTYNSSRVLLPFYLILIIFIFLKTKVNFLKNWFKFLPFLILITITVFQTFNQSGQARYQWVSLLDSGSINKINELRQVYPRFLVNKATYFTFTVTKNYLSHFNPRYLFFNGGSNYQFSLPNFFIFSPFLLPFFVLGVFTLLKNIKKNQFGFLLFWLLISPLPSSITRDSPHILRSVTFLPIVAIIIILGFDFLIKKIPKISCFYIISILIYGQFLFWPKYQIYTINYSSSWQYGYQEIVSFIKDNYSQYDQIIITKKYGEAHEFLLFYWPWNPQKYQTEVKDWNYHTNWYWVDGFDKFKFLNDWEIKDLTKNIAKDQKTLLITSPNNYNQENTKLIQTIKFLDQKPAFQILEIKP
ncbi:MAG: glycosyltransferase family 39 protein [Candidatus Shapirobacteria bacterium]|jgi:4-amino-4-deoxy-L-arabinose transferase-like glycosyltransferase